MGDSVYVLPFRFKHMPFIIEMHELRGNALNTDLEYSDLPKIGYIAFLGKSAVACGFLRRVEPNYGQLDTFLSNPYFGSQVRHLGLNFVTEALLTESECLGLKLIIAITKDESILSRAKDQGFDIIRQTLVGKYLK